MLVLVLLLLLLVLLLFLVLFVLLFLLFGFFAALRSAGKRSSNENPCIVHPSGSKNSSPSLFPGTSHHIPPLPKRSPQKLLGMIQRHAKQAQCQEELRKHFVKYFPQKPGYFWWFPTEVGKILTVSPPPSPPFPASSWRQVSLGCWRLSGARVGEGEKYRVNPQLVMTRKRVFLPLNIKLKKKN